MTFPRVRLTPETSWMFDVLMGNELFAAWATVTGVTEDGITVSSEHVHLNTRRHHMTPNRGTYLSLGGQAVRLRVARHTLPRGSRGLRVIYATVGLQGLGTQGAQTATGKALVAGVSKIKDYDEVGGLVEIRAPERSRPLSKWLQRSDDLAERVLDMVSLAEGRLVRWTARHIVRGTAILVSDFDGPQPSGKPRDGAGHFLNLQPFIDAAVRSYTRRLRDKTGIAVALEWFLSNPRYTEEQLLAAMTALEHLVSAYVRNNKTARLLPARTFRPLKARLVRTLDDFASEGTRPRRTNLQRNLARVRNKIGSLNDPPFRDKLADMLTAYGVPLNDIDSSIRDAIDARNIVVHRGMYSGDPDAANRLVRHVAVLRELLKRIFLVLVEYRGSYRTRFGSERYAVFPPPSGSRQSAA